MHIVPKQKKDYCLLLMSKNPSECISQLTTTINKSSFQCTPPIINNQHKFKLPKEDDAETTKILLISAHDPKPCECKPKLKTEINQNPFQYNPSHKQPT